MASPAVDLPPEQQPDETTEEYVKRLQRRLLETMREKEEAIQKTEEAIQKTEEAIQKTEEVVQKNEELQRQMLPLPLMAFMEQMEDAVFSAFLIQKKRDAAAKTTATNVSKKMYPRSLRPWADFAARHATTFAAIRETLGDAPLFMSPHNIEGVRKRLCRTQAIADEADTRQFIDTAIEEPVMAVVSAYLQTLRPDTPRSVQFQSNAYNKIREGGGTTNTVSPSKDLQPDRWVFVVDDQTKEASSIAVGEVKPPHKVKMATLKKVMAAVRPDSFFSEAIWNLQAEEAEAQKAEAQASSQAATTTSSNSATLARIPGQVLVAQALCQAYYYIILSGCEYGYLLTGDNLVLLRVTENAPHELLYHCAHFPVPHVTDADARRLENHGQRQPHATVVAHLASLCIWASETTAREIEWVNAIKETALRWPTADERKERTLALRGRLGDDGGGDGNDGDGEGGVGGSGSSPGGPGSAGGPSGAGHGPLSTPRLPMPPGQRKRGRSPTRKRGMAGQDAELGWPSPPPPPPPPPPPQKRGPFYYETKLPPYCTQACLLGLVRGLPLDKNCPNVALHRARWQTHNGNGNAKAQAANDINDFHQLTVAALGERIGAQMRASLSTNCECLLRTGQWGRYGVLFKLAVADYGYTFVGKSVEKNNVGVLRHEAAVYRSLQPLQGVLIPVFLGIVDMQREVTLNNLAEVTHLMLMSYAGPTVQSPKLQVPADVDLDAEIDRTLQDLEHEGYYDEDVRPANMAWNAEVGRVMHFDFDQVDLGYLEEVRGEVEEVEDVKEVEEVDTIKDEPEDEPKAELVAVKTTHSPLQHRSDWNERTENTKGDDRAIKRARTNVV